MTKPTKSFFLLSSFAVILATAAMGFYTIREQGAVQPVASEASGLPDNTVTQPQTDETDDSLAVYADSDHGITLRYPKTWALYTGNENKTFYISLYPEGAVQPVSIYIGSEYYGFKGLKTTPIQIENYTGEQVDDTLLGLENSGRFYTFDLSNNSGYQSEFRQLLNTVQLY